MTKLVRVKIQQFRAYEDVEVVFKDDNGVVLMSGDNGSGKSTLLNAICWCLYANTPFYSVEDSDEIINKHAPENSEIRVTLEASIDGNTYVFERKASKDARGGIPTVQKETNGNWEQLEPAAAQIAVNKFLPEDIRHLFIFNGEQISGIFKPDNEKGLRDSIYKISELEIVDKTKKHLLQVENDLLSEIQKSSKNRNQIIKLKQDRINKASDIERQEEAIKILTQKIDANQVKYDELDDIATRSSSAMEMKVSRDQLANDKKELEDELDSLELDKYENIQENFHKALINEEFTQYLKILEEAEKESLLPPPIKPEVTKKILKSKVCICGRDIHDKEVSFIEEQHAKNESANELSYLTGATFVKGRVDEELADAWYLLQDTIKNISDKRTRKSTLERKIQEYNDFLDKVNLSEHDNPVARRNDILADMDIQKKAKTRSEIELERLKREARETEEVLQKIIDKDDNTKALESKRLHVQKILDQLNSLKEEMEETIREKLTKSVSEIFFSIFPDTLFEKINIDKDYSISIEANDGKIYLASNLGTGHAKTLGLSLAYGLSKDMGYETTPMLIDNLYGDIKDTHFDALTKMAETLSKHKQVIITDLNVTKSLSLFNPGSVKQLFSIERISEEHRTVIKENKNG